MRFTCTSCGEVHDGFADLSFAAPYYYYTVPEAERERRCALSSDLCSIDNERLFHPRLPRDSDHRHLREVHLGRLVLGQQGQFRALPRDPQRP
jgi:hypothetical protein